MKKLFIIIFILSSIYSQSQTYIKANAATALLLIPNVGIETSIGQKFTFQADFMPHFGNHLTDIIQ